METQQINTLGPACEVNDESVLLFFGSSVVNTFSLARDDRVRIQKFKGATAKGLGQANANSEQILHTVKSKYSHKDIKAVLWMFGSIDCKLSYYYKLCNATDPHDLIKDPDIFMTECATKYFSFIRSIYDTLKEKQAQSIVFGVEPNGTPPELVYNQCVRYMVIPDTPENSARVKASVARHHPDKLRKTFNSILKAMCVHHGLTFLDIDDHIHDAEALASLSRSVVKSDYRDPYSTCIHLNWEANLVHYADKLQKLGITLNGTLDLEKTREEYLAEKATRPSKRRKIPTALRPVDSEI